MSTISTSRKYPTHCVIGPTKDLYVCHYQSDNIATGRRLAWDGSGYTPGAEVTVVGSGVAQLRGHVQQLPNGDLDFVYVDTGGSILLATSTDAGATWT